jgi:predicted dehydrogenase
MSILIVGGGKMGLSHLALFSAYLGKNNVSICDTKIFKRLLYRKLGYQAHSNVNSALDCLKNIEGVVVATPTPSHEYLVRWSILNNIPCFVEKPLTLNYKKSLNLKNLAKKNGSYVQMGFVMRYLASIQRLKKLINSNKLGRVLRYKASMSGNVITKTPSKSSWQGIFSQGGGCLNEYGPHIIDLCIFVFGKVSKIVNASYDSTFCSSADDHTTFNWIHENSVIGDIDINWCDTTKRKSVIEFNVDCEYGKVRVDNSILEIKYDCSFENVNEISNDPDESHNPPNVDFYLRGEEFSLEVEEFIAACTKKHFESRGLVDNTTPYLHSGCEVDRLINLISDLANLK